MTSALEGSQAAQPWLGDPSAALGSVVGFGSSSFSPLPPSCWGYYSDFEVKNGDVNDWSSLSDNTVFAPGKNGSPIAINIPAPFLYHAAETQSDPGFWDVVGVPEPHTTTAR